MISFNDVFQNVFESICQTFSKPFLENFYKTLSISCDTKGLSSELVTLGLFNNLVRILSGPLHQIF